MRDNIIKIIGGRQHGCTCGIQFYGVDNGLIEKNVCTVFTATLFLLLLLE